MTCAGTVAVDAGWLGGGTSPSAVSSAVFSPYGIRLILAPSVSDGCQMEQQGIFTSDPNGTHALIEITLAPDVGPGTYPMAGNSGSNEVAVMASWTGPGGMLTGQPPVAGTLVLTMVSPTDGLAGSYHLDFGQEGTAGTAATNGSGGAIMVGSLGHLVEDGAFIAPICELCASPPTCGGRACTADQICEGGACVAGPTCSGAPSCGDCGLSGDACEFDGFHVFSEVVFH
jgi:hypothetical protein